jgi:hypothetical protein
MFIPQNLPLPLVFAHAVMAGDKSVAWRTPSISTISPAMKHRLKEAVDDSIRIGAIRRLDVKSRRVWMSPMVWRIWKPEAKEGFTVSVAIYCAEQAASDRHYAEVIDGESGRPLAQYGPSGAVVF